MFSLQLLLFFQVGCELAFLLLDASLLLLPNTGAAIAGNSARTSGAARSRPSIASNADSMSRFGTLLTARQLCL